MFKARDVKGFVQRCPVSVGEEDQGQNKADEQNAVGLPPP
jgi:hypothetical protein